MKMPQGTSKTRKAIPLAMPCHEEWSLPAHGGLSTGVRTELQDHEHNNCIKSFHCDFFRNLDGCISIYFFGHAF
jgi:hypothetical protein